LHLL